MSPEDGRWMEYALRLGHRALGTTAENPAVGCVIVKNEIVLGVGWTQPGGRPHAEPSALAMAGERARGATAYVTLEPCSHHGKTPPCADALVASGIARCVVATMDPDPRVSGRGIERLRVAGIVVDVGCCEAEARRSLAGFLTRTLQKRPYVILKMAISSDGKIASAPGVQTAITGAEVRSRVHLLRAQCNAILVGMGTVRVDDPVLTVRLPGMEHRSPRPFALGQELLPAETQLAKRGAEVLTSIDLTAMAAKGINTLLVEGGASVARSFLDMDVVDEVQLFRAPTVIGPQGVDAVAGKNLETALAAFRPVHEEVLGKDRLTVYVRR